MNIVRAETKQIEKIVNMSIRAFETDVNVGGIKGNAKYKLDRQIPVEQEKEKDG